MILVLDEKKLPPCMGMCLEVPILWDYNGVVHSVEQHDMASLITLGNCPAHNITSTN